jgi:outer membrane protein, multidrug efflux system
VKAGRAAVLPFALAAASLLAGCAVGPNYKRPPITSPAQFRGQENSDNAAPAGSTSGAATSPASPGATTPPEAATTPGSATAPKAAPPAVPPEIASFADQAWWDIFQDDTLKGLIDEALRNGYDVRLAAGRVEEARAEAGISRSEFFPQVSGDAGWSRGRASGFASPVTTPVSVYDVNLGFSWEVDLWGRIRRLNQAALARYLATEEARRGVLLSLVSDVATDYFHLRDLDLQLAIARRTTTAFRETHALFTRRFEAGTASALETSSAAASLSSTAATIPDLERQIADQENQLALLLGRNPEEIPRGAELTDQLLPLEIPAGLPSDLLRRRPDLRQAEQELIAANAEVGVAVADFFPTISLTGAFGGVSPQVSDLFGHGRTWSVGGGLLSPIFQGRRLKNRHRAALARWEQAKVRYEQSVTNAFAEVSTELVAYRKLADAEMEQASAVAAYRQAVSLSSSRYVGGLSDYLEVLQAQQLLFPAENSLARIRFDRLAALVRLYKALGGGWKLADTEWAAGAGGHPVAQAGAVEPGAGAQGL